MAAVIFFLWFISLATDILGSYEYKAEFLMASFSLWALGSFVDGATSKKTVGKRFSTAFRKMGTTLFGIWIILLIFNLLGWLEPVWSGKINYVLATSMISFAVSFTIRASTIRNKNWRIRSTFYSLGFLVVLVWIFMKVFDLFIDYQDTMIIGGIVLLGLGYIIGASKNTHDYDIFEDKIENITKVMKEIKDAPTAKSEVDMLTRDLVIGEDSNIVIKKGSILVDMEYDLEKVGNVFFGEGGITLSSEHYTHKESFVGICYGTGMDWDSVRMEHQTANDEELEALGLSKEDIIELSNIITRRGKDANDRLSDLKKRMKDTKTEINLPYLKILEGVEGDYVKVGPIEVADFKGKGSRLKIGKMEFTDYPEREVKQRSLGFKIVTTEETKSLYFDGEEAKLESEDMYYHKGHDSIEISKKDNYFKRDNGNPYLKNNDIELSMDNGHCSLISRSKGINMKIDDDNLSIEFKGKRKSQKSRETTTVVREMIKSSFDDIVKDVMEDSYMSFNRLIIQITDEIEW